MNKVQKIREEVARIQLYSQSEVLKQVLDYIDEVQKEPVSNPIDFEKELYKAFGQIKDFTLGMRIAKWFYDMGKNSQEPVSEDLNEEIGKYCSNPENFITYIDVGFKQSPIEKDDIPLIIKAIEFGANWQKEQFEKKRLAACDKQTEEEAEIERDFVMGIIEKEHRQPTFDDAIKYGMRLQKEQIKEALLSEVLPYFMHGGEADEVVAKLDEVLNQKK